MRWDIFCQVIDNHGDLGVCWRLARQLATQGDAVRLWIDDASALQWMAPGGHDGVEWVDWRDAAAVCHAADASVPDVLIEAFGCNPAPELIARFARRPGNWINLEYLSAEPYVERLHALPSPVFRGPGQGLTKHFFYPGFTERTGGLLREPGLVEARTAFDHAAWLAAQGIEWHGERLLTLFCYEPPALPSLLAALAADSTPTRLLVTPGRAAAAVRAASPAAGGALAMEWLRAVPQPAFDQLLWSGDLNFVRGEDSLVRALWAGAPLVWQIYPQDDDVHHVKLEAFLDWLEAPLSLRQFHRIWNGVERGTLPRLDDETLADWGAATRAARARLLAQDDLVTRLRRFIAQKS